MNLSIRAFGNCTGYFPSPFSAPTSTLCSTCSVPRRLTSSSLLSGLLLGLVSEKHESRMWSRRVLTSPVFSWWSQHVSAMWPSTKDHRSFHELLSIQLLFWVLCTPSSPPPQPALHIWSTNGKATPLCLVPGSCVSSLGSLCLTKTFANVPFKLLSNYLLALDR